VLKVMGKDLTDLAKREKTYPLTNINNGKEITIDI
jgi:hypothetical protein